MFIPIESRTLILKIVIREIFLLKPKHQYHLSQRGECFYDAKSLKERRLLCQSMFFLIERRTLILKMVIREVFVMKPKHIINPNKENVFLMPNHEKKRDYYVNPCFS